MLEVGQGGYFREFPPKSMPRNIGFWEAGAWLVIVQPGWGRKEQGWWMDELGEYTGQIRV